MTNMTELESRLQKAREAVRLTFLSVEKKNTKSTFQCATSEHFFCGIPAGSFY